MIILFIQIYTQEVIWNLGKNLYAVIPYTIIHNGKIKPHIYGNIIVFSNVEKFLLQEKSVESSTVKSQLFNKYTQRKYSKMFWNVKHSFLGVGIMFSLSFSVISEK